ncbi:MAG: hypothetical protein QOG58_2827 [Caballeronia sp.]|jgi:hypothetical protein|nr:hypothetical protein [Caballeronia sp.]
MQPTELVTVLSGSVQANTTDTYGVIRPVCRHSTTLF